MMPGVAGGSSALTSPQCLGQQAFAEGGASKGYVQQGVYGRGGYPGGSSFTPGWGLGNLLTASFCSMEVLEGPVYPLA